MSATGGFYARDLDWVGHGCFFLALTVLMMPHAGNGGF